MEHQALYIRGLLKSKGCYSSVSTVFILLPLQELSHQVEMLHSEAPQVEAQIKGFQSELVKKTTSLRAVWDKFLLKVDNRRKVLHTATSFYDNLSQVRTYTEHCLWLNYTSTGLHEEKTHVQFSNSPVHNIFFGLDISLDALSSVSYMWIYDFNPLS